MKLVNQNGVELDVKKYPMPTKGVAGSAKINGEDVTTMYTSGRGKDYTYFAVKNVGFYVAGALAADDVFTLDVPEDFAGADEAAVRKSYYQRKRPANADGSVPAGSSDAANAPHTEVRDGVEVAVNPDGSLVSEADQEAARQAGNEAPVPADGEQTATPEGDGSTDPSGAPIDEAESHTEAKKRSKRK